jgi:TRAP-type C4-dicarboxylate transport system permease small subunit
MRPITKLILSILAFAFAIWAIWIAYKIWKGQWESGELQSSLIIVVFLVLSCTYFIASAIQNASKTIANKESESLKIHLYDDVISSWLLYLVDKEKGQKKKLSEKMIEHKAQMSIHTGIRVMQAYNKLYILETQDAKQEDIQESLIQLMLAMRSDIGQSNVGIESEIRQFL